MIFKNKKADDRYLTFWMFANWIVIALAVIIGAVMVYSFQIDTRSAEAAILANRLSDCISENFNYSELSAKNFNIYDKCKLNMVVLNDYDLYYFKILIQDSSKTSSALITGGDGTFAVLCESKVTETSPNFPRCSSKEFLVRDEQLNQPYTLSILTASKQK